MEYQTINGTTIGHIKTDVLVIGGALAGLSAAIAARSQGASVTLLSKGDPGRSGSTLYAAGYITWCPPKGGLTLSAQMNWTSGYVNNPNLVDCLVNQLGDANDLLGQWGLSLQAPFASEQPALAEIGVVKGQPRGYLLCQTLLKQATTQGVTIKPNYTVIELIKDPTSLAVCGAIAVCQTTNTLYSIHATQVIIATGGAARAFARSDNPHGTTGDGFLLALEAGAELIDVELINFGLSTNEMQEAFAKGPASIGESGNAHYFLGGIRIDPKAHTSVSGLLAAGEVTGGLFGAARLGGSALAEGLVYGLQAGNTAAAACQSVSRATPNLHSITANQVTQLLVKLTGTSSDYSTLERSLKQIAWAYAGYIKDETHLQRGLEELDKLAPQINDMTAASVSEFVTIHEIRSIYYTILLSIKAALLRKESRGNFWRSDYPNPDPERGMYNSLVTMSSTKDLLLSQQAIDRTYLPDTLQPIRIAPGCLGYDFPDSN